MPKLFSGNRRKVIVSSAEVAAFNSRWPCSELRDSRAYWFEFDSAGDLVDSDVPQHDDGAAASALADDCRAFLDDDAWPEWGIMERPDYPALVAAAIHRSRMASDISGTAPAKAAKAQALRLVATDIAATLEHADSAFNKAEFLKACGL